MPVKTITREELRSWLDQEREFILLDTALGGDFAAEHLPGAQNACVYEVTFLAQVDALEGIKAAALARPGAGEPPPARDATVVVYGSSERSQASATAAEKLIAAGFTEVLDYRGGLAGWQQAGYFVEGNGEAREEAPLEDRAYLLDVAQSSVEWIGRSLGGKHHGTVNLLPDGAIVLRAGRVTGGNFTLDMTSLQNNDLPDAALRGMLLAHLASDDFFDVEKYPRASFHLESAELIEGASPSDPNYRLNGKFMLKGVEKPLAFPALIGRSPGDDDALVARANFDLDRTAWNVRYGSGKFYEKLGRHLVSDLITLDLKIVAR